MSKLEKEHNSNPSSFVDFETYEDDFSEMGNEDTIPVQS